MHACACADNSGEKRNVLIVSILLPIAATLVPVMGDAEVEVQDLAARPLGFVRNISILISDFHISILI